MIVMQKNPHIDRLIEFIAKFASSLSHNANQQSNAMDTSTVEPPARTTRSQANTQQEPDSTLVTDQTQSNTFVNNSQEEDEEFENVFLTSLIDFLIQVWSH